MRLTLQKPFKSVRQLDSVELPDFAVLTGVNGSGKPHLLRAIRQGDVVVEGIAATEIEHFDWSVQPGNTSADPDLFPKQTAQHWSGLEQHRAEAVKRYQAAVTQHGLNRDAILDPRVAARLSPSELVFDGESVAPGEQERRHARVLEALREADRIFLNTTASSEPRSGELTELDLFDHLRLSRSRKLEHRSGRDL